MYDFLSEEWIDAARAIREKYAEQVPQLEVAVRLNQVITDVPFSDDNLESYIDTSAGTLELELGQLDAADATITTSYDLAYALLMGGEPQLFMQAFLEGRIQVQGEMSRLIALQLALAQNAQADGNAASQVAAEIKAITK